MSEEEGDEDRLGFCSRQVGKQIPESISFNPILH